jgi:hypothetical protein
VRPRIKSFLGVIAFPLLSGCTVLTDQQVSDLNLEIARTTPMCYSPETCEAAWAAARTWIQQNAGFKLQTYSSDFMETYNPTNSSPELAASVSKEPIGGGKYQLTIKLWCDNMFGCQPNEKVAHATFNQFVNERIAKISMPTQSQITRLPQ